MKSRWCDKMSHILAVPQSVKSKIKQQFSTPDEQLKEFVQYIYNFHPQMSWNLLAGVLYSLEEQRALEKLTSQGYLKAKNGIQKELIFI